jgi:NAD+ diphosphatase
MPTLTTHRFERLIDPGGHDPAAPGWHFLIADGQLLLLDGDGALPLPRVWAEITEAPCDPAGSIFLGLLDGVPCWAAALTPALVSVAAARWIGLRAVYTELGEELFWLAGRAAQLIAWNETHRFCGRCGVPTERLTTERATRCPRCGLLNFPRLSPAIIVAIERDGKLLLARNAAFKNGFFSILAGFVEPGEDLESAVRREVREEVGIEIDDIRYQGSQPWPFPNSLMIGFTARWAGGEIAIDGREIAEAGWFGPDEMPELPASISISRRLIDGFLARAAGAGTERS